MAEHGEEILAAAEACEEIADNIKRVAEAAEKLLSTGLSNRGLVVLLRDATGVRVGDIRAVLYGLETLRERYIEDLADARATSD